MSNFRDSEALLKRSILVNLFTGENVKCTPLLNGAHGQGKSAICRQVAKDLGGFCLTVEGGSLKEGEITGIPFITSLDDGKKAFRFAPYYQVDKVQNLAKYYYEVAHETGFLNGSIKLDENDDLHYVENGVEKTIKHNSQIQNIFESEQNRYMFGEDLPPMIKLELLKRGDIKPVIIFIDEMNRTDTQTMRELMNIVLTRSVNGYKFPWWVFMVSAINPCDQDSMYATNEMDPAQLDRFLLLNFEIELNEFCDYGMDAGLSTDYLIALTTVSDAFQVKGSGYSGSDSDDKIKPTARSHELCAYIYGTKDILNRSGFFTDEEIANSDSHIRTMILGKIGKAAGRDILAAIKNKENFIDPSDLITGKDVIIDPKLANKITNMKMGARNILTKSVIRYMATDMVKYFYLSDASVTKNAEDRKKYETTWKNILSQIKAFLNCLDSATQMLFASNTLHTQINISDSKFAKYNNKDSLFHKIATAFSTELVSQIKELREVKGNGSLDVK